MDIAEGGAARNTYSALHSLRERNKDRWLLLVVWLLLSAYYFAIPMGFAPDSATYFRGAQGILAGQGWALQPGFRGPGLSLLLLPFFALFGQTVTAVRLCWFVLYTAFYLAAYALLCALGLMRGRASLLGWLFFVFALMLNPHVVAYSHLCLTEFPALLLLTLTALLFARLYQAEAAGRLARAGVKKTLALSVSVVCMYATKQAAFPAVLALYGACELVMAVRTRGAGRVARRLAGAAVGVLAALLLLGGYMRVWNRAMQGNTVEGSAAQSYAASFLVDGLRYFRPAERGVTGRPVTIELMAYDYSAAHGQFSWTFDGSMGNTLAFWRECFARDPARVLAGYVDNYRIIAGTTEPTGLTGEGRAYSAVSGNIRFGWSQETFLWCEHFRQADASLTTSEFLQGGLADPAAYNASPVRRVSFNTYYYMLANLQYGALTHFAPLLCLVSAAGALLCRRRGWNAGVHTVNFVCALTVFLQTAFLAVTAQCIDRYGFPVTVLCFVMTVNTAVGLARLCFARPGRAKRLGAGERPGQPEAGSR